MSRTSLGSNEGLHYAGPHWLHWIVRAIGTICTFLALTLLYLDLTGRIPQVDRDRYVIADTCLCAVFALEFLIMISLASNRRLYLRRHWVDLLASIPMVHEMRSLRAVRAMRLLRAFRAGSLLLRAFRQIEDSFAVPLMRSTLVVAGVALIVGSLAIADVERENATLNSFEKGLWWCLVTMTTVGYGDAYPATGLGKFIAAILMIVGVGLFGAMAGTFASLLLRSSRDQESATPSVEQRLADLESRCARLETQRKDATP